jgi:branched-chain amino acid transport system ATP-binding protein
MSLMADDCILETTGLVKEFRGFVAVNGVNLKVKRGHIHALIGPNGAGKTTCFNLLTKFSNRHAARSASTARTSRTSTGADRPPRHRPLLPDFRRVSASDGAGKRAHRLQRKLGTSFHFWKSERSLDALNDRAMELLASVGLDEHAGMVTVEMPYGRKRALEIATTLALDPELMLLDEPTQGMGHEDVAPGHGPDQEGVGQPHRADGRAQHEGGGRHFRHASPCWRAARCWPRDPTPRCRRIRGDRGLHGQRPRQLASPAGH